MSDLSKSPLPTPLAFALRRLRTKLTIWLVVYGVSRVLSVMVLLLVVDFLLDRTFHMDQAQRLVLLCVALLCISVVVIRQLLLPLRSRPTDEALCLEVESRRPQSDQSLISSLQLSRFELKDLETRGYSSAMVAATIEAGARAADETGFEQVVHRQRHWTNVLLATIMGGILLGAGLSTLASPVMEIWFHRNVMLGERQWPHDVILRVAGAEQGQVAIPRDGDWPILVTVDEASRRQPTEVTVELRTDDGNRMLVAEASGAAFSVTLRDANDATHLRARCGRSSTDWLPIQWINRPEWEALRLTVIPPPYTGLGSEELALDLGPYHVLPGSRLRLQGTASKSLSGARISAAGWSLPLQVRGNEFQGELAGERLQDAVYHIQLTDTEQIYSATTGQSEPLESRQPMRFSLRLQGDQQPQVRAELNGVSGMVVPQARVPITCRVSDDFGLVGVRLASAVVEEQREAVSPQALALTSLVQLPATEARFEYEFDLRSQQLTVGSTLQFHLEAEDNNNVSGPSTGRSKTFLLRVVNEQDLRADLLRREKELRQDFKQLVVLQETLVTDTQTLAAGLQDEMQLATQHLQLLVEIQKRQKVIGTKLGNIARRFEDIALEVGNNRIEDKAGPLQTRLRDKIVEPTWLLADDTIPDLVNDFGELRRSEGTRARKQKVTNVIRDQQQIVVDMQEILGQMEQSEGFQAAVNMLYEVQQAQEDVLRLTDEERAALIKQILESAPQPK